MTLDPQQASLFAAFLASQGQPAAAETVPAAVAAVGAAQAAQGGPALTGPERLTDSRPEGQGQAVYVRDLPVSVTFNFSNGKPPVTLALAPRTFGTGSVGVGAYGKLPVSRTDGTTGSLQCSLNLPLGKPSARKG